jgi:hypothetical protein
MACVDLPEEEPVWKKEWFWGAMSFVGAMALGLFSLTYKKGTEAKDRAREDPEVQIPEQGVVIAKTSKKLII